MNKKYKAIFFTLLCLVLAGAVFYLLKDNNFAVLNPKGEIAAKQRDLIITSTLLMLIVVIPVLVFTFFIAWKYRASNNKARYSPDWDGNKAIETTWWAIPSAIILVLSVITWTSSHELDPFKPIAASAKPVTVHVVALQWKWLFIYPEQNIATVNLVQFPVDTPVNFVVTADAPMNSFWIPQLGGQIYAMAGMHTKLHLIADETGYFRGSSANISGRGFAGMKFIAKSSSKADFDSWVKSVKSYGGSLTMSEYNQLAEPSENTPASSYSSTEKDLQAKVIAKYLAPPASGQIRYHNGDEHSYDANNHR